MKKGPKNDFFLSICICILNIQKPAETLSAILAWTNSLSLSLRLAL